MSNMHLDAAVVRRQIETLRDAYPEIFGDDEEAVLALESETELTELATRIVKVIGEAEAEAEGIKAYQAELAERKARKERKAEGMRSMLLSLMEAAGVPKLPLPIATLSVGPKPASVVITDEAAIPDDYFRVKREVDKTLIKKAISDGFVVTGASLSNGGSRLTVRTR